MTWERLPPGSGRTGVLAVGGAMPRGYLQDDTKTATTFRVIDGVRYTMPGDYAFIDADGTVHLLGRGSVCINTGGEKVYPEEVEVAARTRASRTATPSACPTTASAKRSPWSSPGRQAPTPTRRTSSPFVKGQLAGYKAPRPGGRGHEIRRSGSGKADYRWAWRCCGCDHRRSDRTSGRDVEQLGVAAQVGGHLCGRPVARQEDQAVDAHFGEGPPWSSSTRPA